MAGAPPPHDELRLSVLDTLAFSKPEVEIWVFGHDVPGMAPFAAGAPPLSLDPHERWALLSELAHDGLVDFEPAFGIEHDVRTGLFALRDPNAILEEPRAWRSHTFLTEAGAARWERARDVDWAWFYSTEEVDVDHDDGTRADVHLLAGGREARDRMVAVWKAAEGVVLAEETAPNVETWPATYWKTLPVAFAHRFRVDREAALTWPLRAGGLPPGPTSLYGPGLLIP